MSIKAKVKVIVKKAIMRAKSAAKRTKKGVDTKRAKRIVKKAAKRAKDIRTLVRHTKASSKAADVSTKRILAIKTAVGGVVAGGAAVAGGKKIVKRRRKKRKAKDAKNKASK